MLKTIISALALTLVGCATTRPEVVKISAPFNEVAAAEAMKPGNNIITGSAFMRQRGGGVVTCAGASVELLPATPYAIERIGHLYGNKSEGLRTVAQHQKPFQFDPDAEGYIRIARKTKCDAQGKFTFEKVADGEFFLVTTVVWSLSTYTTDGGTIMQRLSVSGGEAKSVVLSF
jgi:hypothetical protein